MGTVAKASQPALRMDPPYTYGKPDRHPNLTHEPVFRYTALEAGGKKRTRLERVEACSWNDVNAIITGSITVRDQALDSRQPRLNQGDRVLCEVNEGAGFGPLWTLRCGKPDLSAALRQRTFDLVSDYNLLAESTDELTYRVDRHHPHGWTGPQIIRDICAKYRVPIGRIYTSPKRLPRMHLKGSPRDMISAVVKRERRLHGRRLVIRFDNGHLYVMPLHRSPHLLLLGPTLIEARMVSNLPPEFASVVMMRSNAAAYAGAADAKGRKKGKPLKKHMLIESKASVRRFGYVRRVVFSPDAHSEAQLRQQGKAWLAAVAKPIKTVTLTHQGIPRLKRGDAIQLAIGDWGMRRQIVFVNQIQHTVSPTNYVMTVQCIFDDPYLDRRGLSILYRLVSSTEEAQTRYNALTAHQRAPTAKDDTLPSPYTPGVSDFSAVPGFMPGDASIPGVYG